MKLEIPTNVKILMQTLEDNGYECYVVGGAIRSLLLHLPVHDYDLTTNALPDEMEEALKDFKLIETGIQHGTITVISSHMPVEITTYRKDTTYKDHRHPDEVVFTHTIKEDCARRDFTINAFCYNDTSGILDFFEGRKDLDAHLIRCIGDPYQRFEEDALRILRAIRFASQLGFEIEENTSKAIMDLKYSLRYVSMERIHEEFTRFLSGEGCVSLFYPYRKVISIFLHEIDAMDEEWESLIKHLKASKKDPDIRMAILLTSHCFSDPKNTLRRMKYSNADILKITQMIAHQKDPIETRKDILHLLNTLQCDFTDYMEYRNAMDQTEHTDAYQIYDSIRKNGDCYSLKQLAINGNDLLKAGFQGKEISETLQKCLSSVMNGNIPNTREALLEFIQQ